ncbi:MAG TPA: thiamine pyrophosphate-dependent enzyme [Candidatus Acidoferrales bacterium]|nr:thiamine pyrophosphate-dependent enzyme [Candidatus Acidoferrales bacterium]
MKTAADILIETLIHWGVEVIFGFPGDGINGIFESLRTHAEKINFVQVRHEEAAAFMATGYAKFTGKLGVCLATSGPGAIHLLNGLYDAKMDGQPVLAITGMAYHDLIGTHGQQDVETDKLFMDVAIYNERVMGPTHVETITEIACRTAETYRGVAHIAFPKDTQSMPYDPKEQKSVRNRPNHVSMVRAKASGVPRESQLHEAAELLNDAKKICILAGRGALHATDELEQVAEILGAPIVKALLGKAAVPDDSPYTTGSIGLLGTKPSEEAIRNCDLLFMIGSAFPYMEFLPAPGEAKCVQIELNPGRISLRYPADVGLVGDSKETLKLLIPMLKKKKDRGFLKKAQSGMKDWWEYMERLGTWGTTPLKPQMVAWELGKRLRSDAIVACDSGTAATWYARQIRARRGQMYSLSGNLATMAVGLPYALAAQYAYPNRQVVALVGDGAFTMLGFEMLTAVKYKLPVKVVVLKNNYLGQIKWEQMVMLGNPEYGVTLQPMDFAKFAEACGAYGMRVEDPGDVPNAMDRFLDLPGPAVLEAVVDPLTAPLPAEVKPEQAIHFAESLVRGEPKARKIMKEAFLDRARELV